jgi:hypothetical protein
MTCSELQRHKSKGGRGEGECPVVGREFPYSAKETAFRRTRGSVTY